MADSDSSSLSSAPTTDDEAMEKMMSKSTGIGRYFKPVSQTKEATPPPPKRSPSPAHEYTFADNDKIAFLVMFRSRFSDAFPKSLPHYGPQDIERGVSGNEPDEQVERLLCALLGLVLNRKKDVERGHYGRALEDAISTNQNQWPTAWQGANPLHGGKSFNTMSAEERLTLLKALVLWSLNSSEAVQALIKESYKQTRRDDDKNQPRSVQPWFSDSYRRRYWLVEGQDDSFFRIYRENDGKTTKSNTWFSVAGSIEEVNALAEKFATEATTNAKINSDKLLSAVPRFEAGDVKRQRREYRLARKAAFTRPEPGFSLYEGRTRGKRMKYTYSDGEEETDYSTRRSTRHATPLDNGPTITASGRQVKSRLGGAYGESLLTDQRKELEAALDTNGEETDDMITTTAAGRPMRGAAKPNRPSVSTHERHGDGMDTDSDEKQSDGEEWSGNDEESDKDSQPDFDDDDEDDDEDEEMSDELLEEDDLQDEGGTQESLVVQLRYRKAKTPIGDGGSSPAPQRINGNEVQDGAVHGYRTLAPASYKPVEHVVQFDSGPVPPAVELKANGIGALESVTVNSGSNGVHPEILNGKGDEHLVHQQPQAMNVS